MEAKKNLLTTMGIDGKQWSEEFCQRFPQCEVDDVWGWFCNAIMTGYDRGWQEAFREMLGLPEDMKVYKSENIVNEESYKAGKLEGRREVVEWIDENCIGCNTPTANQEDYMGIQAIGWQAKLKEWGLLEAV